MIRYSNNWATNRLIQRIGMAMINQRLDDLGLAVARINRYITGAGAPSVHGNAGSYQGRVEGWENVSTPREMVKLLRRVLQDNVLSDSVETLMGVGSVLRFSVFFRQWSMQTVMSITIALTILDLYPRRNL